MIRFFSRGTISSNRRSIASCGSLCRSPGWIGSASLHIRSVVTSVWMFLHSPVRQMRMLMDLLSISGRHYASLGAYEYPHKALSFRKTSFQPSGIQHKAPRPHQLCLARSRGVISLPVLILEASGSSPWLFLLQQQESHQWHQDQWSSRFQLPHRLQSGHTSIISGYPFAEYCIPLCMLPHSLGDNTFCFTASSGPIVPSGVSMAWQPLQGAALPPVSHCRLPV